MDPLEAYKYHPVTGNKLIKEGNLLKDSETGNPFFINAVPTALGLLVDEDGKVGLVKRAKDPKKGTYDLPGGFVDLGEKLEESLQRELLEELQLEFDASSFRYFGSYPDQYVFSGINDYTIGNVFVVKIKNSTKEKMIPSDDISSIEWFDINEIPENADGFPTVNKCLADYISKHTA